MRILLLSQWYPPEPVLLPHQWAKELLRRGHQVTVITGFPNYPTGEIYTGYRVKLRQQESIEGVPVLRLPIYPNHDARGAKRALNYLSFSASTSVLGPVMAESADIMWVFDSLMAGLGAASISRVRRIPFIYCVQDLWPETLSATGAVTSARAVRWISHIADFVYRQAAAITVISPGFKRNLIEKGVPAEKIHFISNWADESIYKPAEYNEAFAAKYGLEHRFNIIYAGNMGIAQALDNVLEAAKQLVDLSSLQFVLIGDGVEAHHLHQQAETAGLSNIRFIQRQPASEIPNFFACAEGLLVHLKRDPLFEITIPSKTIAYLACGRPIISVAAGDAADVITRAGAGLVCPPEDPGALAHTVRQFFTLSQQERDFMGMAGRRAFLRQYSQSVVMNSYEGLLEQVASKTT